MERKKIKYNLYKFTRNKAQTKLYCKLYQYTHHKIHERMRARVQPPPTHTHTNRYILPPTHSNHLLKKKKKKLDKRKTRESLNCEAIKSVAIFKRTGGAGVIGVGGNHPRQTWTSTVTLGPAPIDCRPPRPPWVPWGWGRAGVCLEGGGGVCGKSYDWGCGLGG